MRMCGCFIVCVCVCLCAHVFTCLRMYMLTLICATGRVRLCAGAEACI